MRSEKITFLNKKGIELAARLDRPDEEPIAYALAAHCFTCSKDVLAMHYISQSLIAHGIGVMRFDFTGLGSSDGEFAQSHFSSNLEDIRAAIAYLNEHRIAPSIMFGHSLGGTAILATAGEVSSVKLVATIGSPYEPAHATHFFDGMEEMMEKDAEACVTLGGRRFTINRKFLEDLNSHSMDKAIKSIEAYKIIFHDPEDEIVEIENARFIFEAALHPKSFIALPKAGHMLSKQRDAEMVGSILDAVIRKVL